MQQRRLDGHGWMLMACATGRQGMAQGQGGTEHRSTHKQADHLRRLLRRALGGRRGSYARLSNTAGSACARTCTHTRIHKHTCTLTHRHSHRRAHTHVPRACTHPRTHVPLSHTRTHARAHARAARELEVEESARTASRGFLNTSSSSSLKLFGLKYGCMSHQHWYLRRAKACGWAHRRRRARASALACVRAIRVCVRACACMHAICMSMRACACTRASVRACVWMGGDRSGLRATRTGA